MKSQQLLLSLLCLVSLATSQDSSCKFTVGSNTYNICPLTTNDAQSFNTVVAGNLHYSLGNNIASCNSAGEVWGVLDNFNGYCYDIAMQPPTYTEIEGSSGGLNITFPVTDFGDVQFQLQIVLQCAFGAENATFGLSQLNESTNSSLVTYTMAASSSYGCPTNVECPLTNVNGYDFNLCPLQSNVFNISDSFGGYLVLSLANSPQITGCTSNPNPAPLVYGNYYSSSGTCFAVTSNSPSNYDFYEGDPNNGLMIEFSRPGMGQDSIFPFVIFDLQCDPNLSKDAPIEPTMNVSMTPEYAGSSVSMLAFKVTAASSYGCPVSSQNINM